MEVDKLEVVLVLEKAVRKTGQLVSGEVKVFQERTAIQEARRQGEEVVVVEGEVSQT